MFFTLFKFQIIIIIKARAFRDKTRFTCSNIYVKYMKNLVLLKYYDLIDLSFLIIKLIQHNIIIMSYWYSNKIRLYYYDNMGRDFTRLYLESIDQNWWLKGWILLHGRLRYCCNI